MVKKSMRALASILIVFSVIVGLAWLGHNTYLLDKLKTNLFTNKSEVEVVDGTLEVHYLDVGQGDSTYIRLNDFDMLIDATTLKDSDSMMNQLKELNVKDLDLVIATHPHEDHIGGMEKIFKEYEVKSFYMPKIEHTTKTFQKMMQAVKDEGLQANIIKEGTELPVPDGLKAQVFAPMRKEYEDLNSYSPIIKLSFNSKSFMFTGDAEKDSEQDVVTKYGEDLKADVLKYGHHGSSTSTSEAFLNSVKPSIGIISCGTNNKYGHPHKETIQKSEERKIQLYETDKDGAVTIKTDGTSLKVSLD